MKVKGKNKYGAKPVKVGDVLTVTIEGQGSRGDGIAKVKGFVVFVPGARKGDMPKVKIKYVGKNFATATILSE